MSETFFRALSLFRPTDKDLSAEERAQIQIHRLLSVLGAVFVPLFGPLYATYNPEAVDPEWARFGLSGLFLILLLASYGIKAVRQDYIVWMRGLLYVLSTWFVVITALNHFAGNYAVGLLLVYAVLTVVVGLGVHSIRPVFWFVGTGFLLTTGSGLIVSTSETSLPILLLCMATVAIVGSVVIQTQLSILQELRAAKEEAEEASRLKSAMLTNMGHELRTPLTSINGHAQLLVDELDGQLRTFARRIYESGQLLMSTLNSVLDLSQLEAGTYTLDRKAIRLDERVGVIAEEFRSMAEKNSIELTTDMDPPVKGRFDEEAMTRIVENLIENAIKFTPEGGRVEIRVYKTWKFAVIEVEDTGIGISEDALPDVFTMFRQESEGLDREYEGTGLGLSIVEQFVEMLRGTIQVETQKGNGSCFTVRLPLSRESGENRDDRPHGREPHRSVVDATASSD